MLIAFGLWLIDLVLIWFGLRKSAIGLFIITLIFACLVLNYHVTSNLNIDL